MTALRIGFVGGGGIARAHAYALAALPYYYPEAPDLVRAAVATTNLPRASAFARRYGFRDACEVDAVWRRDDLDTIFILSPNEQHCAHLRGALALRGVKRIYLEKPVCVRAEEEEIVRDLADRAEHLGVVVQVGFQFLQLPCVRGALKIWRAGEIGVPIHFTVRYLHSGYLGRQYRQTRRSRLRAFPKNGALVDLGSHAFSLLCAFLGPEIAIAQVRTAAPLFDDVPKDSDLCTCMLAYDGASPAVGTLIASRVSAGAGECLEMELHGTRGAFRISGDKPDVLETSRAPADGWMRTMCGREFPEASQFPSATVASGWLRSLVHAHYLFFGGADPAGVKPSLRDGLTVQRLVRIAGEKTVPNGLSHDRDDSVGELMEDA